MWHCHLHFILKSDRTEKNVASLDCRAAETRSGTLPLEAITGCTALPLQFPYAPIRGISCRISRRTEEAVKALQFRWYTQQCRIQDQTTQYRQLAEPDLTLQKAFEVARAIESAGTQVKESQHSCMTEVHTVSYQFWSFWSPVQMGHLAAPPTNNSPSTVHPLFTPSQSTV